MFGVSFLEIAVVALVALVVVGPQKLPSMLRTAGEWVAKLRRITSDVRKQTGIDDILREEGIDGVAELRTLLRGQFNTRGPNRSPSPNQWSPAAPRDPDPSLEFPVEGADCASALPDDLIANTASVTSADGVPSASSSSDDDLTGELSESAQLSPTIPAPPSTPVPVVSVPASSTASPSSASPSTASPSTSTSDPDPSDPPLAS